MAGSNDNPNESFKLIALKVGEECHKDIRKNLETGKWYFFDQDYEEGPSGKIDRKGERVPDNFYQLSDYKGPTINIHAIVGKNGCGKSTLIDIVLMLINNYAYDSLVGVREGNLRKESELRAELYFTLGGKEYTLTQTDDPRTQLTLVDQDGTQNNVPDLDGSNFFYTVLLNYSLYAFNTKECYSRIEDEEKHWLNGLFHKNDGYQAPIVINPKREEGNIDTNIERDLAKARLLSLILRESQESRTEEAQHLGLLDESYGIGSLVIKVHHKYQTIDSPQELKLMVSSFLSKIGMQALQMTETQEYDEEIEKIISAWGNYGLKLEDTLGLLSVTQDPLKRKTVCRAYAYLYYKTISIAWKYGQYLGWSGNWEAFVQSLISDRSHVTFKLHQTINFLQGFYNPIIEHYADLLPDKDGLEAPIHILQGVLDLQHSGLKDGWVDYTREERIYRLPPPFFDIDFYINTRRNEQFLFSRLSSGERQLMYTIACVLYHLRNLNSVEVGSKNEDNETKRVKYRNINLVFDEIELYFHPEYQRRFIERLINGIESMHFHQIDSINILFATHSPFILSDIPKSKILFLDNGRIANDKITEETFASNIHTLLRQAFFLDGGTMGEFAKKKVLDLADQISMLDHRYQDPAEHFSSEDSELDDSPQKAIKLLSTDVALVGEPILRRELQRNLSLKASSQEIKLTLKLQRIGQELVQVQQELANLNKRSNDSDKTP